MPLRPPTNLTADRSSVQSGPTPAAERRLALAAFRARLADHHSAPRPAHLARAQAMTSVPALGPDPTANRAALQAAIDAAPHPGVVVVPAGDWSLDRPLHLDRDLVTLRGEPGATLQFPASAGLIVGIPRSGKGAPALPADAVIDGTGRLDAIAGTRCAVRLAAGRHLVSNGGPFQSCRGDYWRGRSQVTVDWALDLAPGGAACAGMSDGGTPYPILVILNYQGAGVCLMVGIEGRPAIDLRFGPPLGPGLHRIALQGDFKAGKVACWVDGVAVPRQGNGAIPTGSFSPNRRVPLKIGAAGGRGDVGWSDYYDIGRNQDFTLLGFALSAGLRYKWDAADLTRLDGNPVNDNLTYFTDWAPVVGLFTLADDPGRVLADRVLAVRQGQQPNNTYGWGTALLLSPEHGSPAVNVGRVEICGLSVRAAGGDGILAGNWLYGSVERCDLGGSAGLGSWNWGPVYPLRLRDTTFHGPDAGLDLCMAMVDEEGLDFPDPGRHAVHLRRGARSRARNVFIGPGAGTESYVRVASGSDLIGTDWSIDEESADTPSEAVIAAESDGASDSALGGRVIAEDWNLGAFNRAVPFLRATAKPGAPKGLIRIVDPTTSGAGKVPMKGWVAADPARWWITVKAPGMESWPVTAGKP